jgi:hypothetical protein
VLWFEHDLFCLIHLVHLLQRFAAARVSLVWCPIPISENDERALHLLFESRSAVTPSMLKTAAAVWRAYTSSDPTTLNEWLTRDTPDFPFLREGLTLHASRFPPSQRPRRHRAARARPHRRRLQRLCDALRSPQRRSAALRLRRRRESFVTCARWRGAPCR